MSTHLTDGTLHAFLDGELDAVAGTGADDVRQHLERCPSCRARLAGEEELRAAASEILGAAVPAAGPLPALEELRARARATAPRPASARSLGPRRRWAWAASVVLALGAGWAVRDRAPVAGGAGDGRAAQATGSVAARAAAEARPPSAAGEPTAPALEEGALDPAAADGPRGEFPSGGAPGASRPSREAAVAGEPQTSAGPREGAGPAEVPSREDTETVASAPGRPDGVDAGAASTPARGLALREVAPTGARAPAGEAADGEDRAAADVTPAMAAAQPPAPASTAPDALLDGVAVPSDAAAARATPAGAAAVKDASVESAPSDVAAAEDAPADDAVGGTAGPGPRVASPDERESAADADADVGARLRLMPEGPGAVAPTLVPGRRPVPADMRRAREPASAPDSGRDTSDPDALVLTVEAFEVLSVEWSEVARGVRAVRVLQRIEPSDTLELVVIAGGRDDGAAEAALDAVLDEPLRRGWSRVVRVREGARIVALAPLSAAELSRLVEDVGRR